MNFCDKCSVDTQSFVVEPEVGLTNDDIESEPV